MSSSRFCLSYSRVCLLPLCYSAMPTGFWVHWTGYTLFVSTCQKSYVHLTCFQNLKLGHFLLNEYLFLSSLKKSTGRITPSPKFLGWSLNTSNSECDLIWRNAFCLFVWLLCVYVLFVYVHVCICMYVCGCASHMGVLLEARDSRLLSCFNDLPLLPEMKLHWTSSSLIRQDYWTVIPRDPPGSAFPELGVQQVNLLYRCWGSNVRSCFLWNKYFTGLPSSWPLYFHGS